ncbi:MAG: inorganic phosphate transporter [Acidimicrobiales bacterium]
MALLAVAVVVALAFDVTNGFHDSANAIAALVATKAARPAQALALAAVFHVLGPLLAGTAVADTVGGIIALPSSEVVPAIGAALTGALIWNLLTWWRGLPSSSSHALVGGLVGAALLEGGTSAVNWGGIEHLKPVGVIGVLISLAVSPMLGFLIGFAGAGVALRATRRARSSIETPVRRSEWLTAATLAFSHGANDAQKTMGVITAMLVAQGRLDHFVVPLWVKLAAAAALTLGTSFGGWRIVRTVGTRIYRVGPLDGLVSQAGSSTVILASAAVGAPVSTTHVVASSSSASGPSNIGVTCAGRSSRRCHSRGS